MGIPHLSHQLSPYGEKVVLPQNSTDHENAIIDGPSLAYHVFSVCIASRTGARNAFEATPTYQELGQAAVDWLEQIELYGLKIKAVYFDGLLPLSKQSTRLSRLQGYTNQLVTFRSLHKEDLPARRDIVPTSKLDVLSAVVSSNRLKALPAPPFMVPAVIEMLLESRYSALVSVIPGEADAYCAEAAREFGGVIFTSDSDLLVHDLGVSGKVILYRDLETIHLPSRGKCLKTQQYHPAGIAQRFSLLNLVKLAFFMSQDHHKSITENARLAAKDTPMSSGFAEFAEQYGSLPKLSKLAVAQAAPDTVLSATLSRLDPRISEITHLISLEDKDDISSPDEDSHNLNMYLPFIIDDPTRTSAWRAGASIRLQAYILLRLLNPRITQVTEFERKGTRVAATVATLIEDETSNNPLTTNLQAFTTSLQQTLSQQPQQLSPPAKWRAVAANLVCQSNLENDKPAPHSNDMIRLITATREGMLSWSFIHASAQFQTCLYSLRMLSQIASVVYHLLEHNSGIHQEIFAQLKGLMTLLNGLPSLRDLLDKRPMTKTSSIEAADVEIEAAKTAVVNILHSLSITEETSTSSTSKKMKKKRKKKDNDDEHAGNKRTSPGGAPSWKGGSNNMFSNLA